MRKITDPNTISDNDIVSGIMVNYIGQGLGAGKVGLVVYSRNGFCIKWSIGGESVDYSSFEALFYINSRHSEFYKV